jgi:hypothetical protein
MEYVLVKGTILVTVGYFILWYFLLFIIQRQTKYRLQREYEEKGEVFDRYYGQDAEMLAADRVVINTQEQMIPFLVSLWLHTIYFSAFSATILGFTYVALRAIYPVLMGKKLSNINPKKVYFVTFPCYGIIFYMFGTVVYSLV